MSLPINTLDGITKRVNALKLLILRTPESRLKERARQRLEYWEHELWSLEIKIADEYIDNILDELV